MVYRNNTGRLGFWLHQCVLRNTLAGSKTVVSTSRNPTVHHKHTLTSQTYTYITNIHLHHEHTLTSRTYTYITNIHLHQQHTPTSQTYTDITNIHLHHKHTPTSQTYTYITNIHLHHKHTPTPQTYTYRVVPGSRNWQVETALEFWPVSCTIFRNLLPVAGIWGSFLRFIETGCRIWLEAFLWFFYDFSMMSMIFLWFFRIF